MVQELAGMIKGCSEEISGKLEGLLKLSQLEDDSFQLHLEAVDLPALLGQVGSNFGLMAAQKGQRISQRAGESIAVSADRARLQEVFENLLSNAIKYAYPTPRSPLPSIGRASRQWYPSRTRARGSVKGTCRNSSPSLPASVQFRRARNVPMAWACPS
jgi:signal transduction histidine kinase